MGKYALQYQCFTRDKWKTVDIFNNIDEAKKCGSELKQSMESQIPEFMSGELKCQFRVKEVR